MKNKIELLQELFNTDSTSKVFFPLAKLYAETGLFFQAEDALRKGLGRHPDHTEARLLLIDILLQMDKREDAMEEIGAVVETMARYPAFWALWADKCDRSAPDASVSLRFLASYIEGSPLSWTEIIKLGIEAASGARLSSEASRETGPPAAVDETAARHLGNTEAVPETEQAVEEEEEGNLRTRTMAELLVSQGDYKQALEIFRELLEFASDPADIRSIELRMEAVRSMMSDKRQDIPAKDDPGFMDTEAMRRTKRKLSRSLEILARRLEARASAGA
jgi:tetratricopeptide (TPR) repeat protein